MNAGTGEGYTHLDHIGNIEMFPHAIHAIQKMELYQAWWPEKFQRGGAHVLADYDDARDFTYLELEGDYDLFGDGSVRFVSTADLPDALYFADDNGAIHLLIP